jgi:hypothetical protein
VGLCLSISITAFDYEVRGDEAKPPLGRELGAERQAASIAARLVGDKGAGGPRVALSGLAPEQLVRLAEAKLNARGWTKVLALYVAGDRNRDVPPVMGSYRIRGVDVEFTPRFPLRAGVKYVAVFDPASVPGGGKGERVEFPLSIAKADATPSTRVATVYPSADDLPENLLKFYLHFSAPMSRGDSYRHIRLIDAQRGEVADPFLEIGEELWDASGRRLTVLFDPGRIKRGLKPREEAGPPLVEGRAYALVVEAAWRDAKGAPLTAEFRKEFRVTAPDDVQPEPQRWRVAAPAAGTRDPLIVRFDEPLDQAMLERVVEVLDPAGDAVVGDMTVDRHERRWQLRPAAPWTAGDYQLAFDPALEDRAGNSIARPFEVDVVADPQEPPSGRSTLPFAIRIK